MGLKEQIDKYAKAMAEWEAGFGLCESKLECAEIDSILNMGRDRLAELSSVEASHKAFVLAQFAFALQRRENQGRAFVQWARENRRRAAGQDAAALDAMCQQAELKLTRIGYLGRRVEFMAQCLTALQRAKRKEEEQ